MSVELVKEAMRKFLADPTPEVLCIKGRWGTGKTYAWEDAVKKSLRDNELSITKYAYVSLFGMKDSSDILQSVFANTADLAVIDDSKKLPDKLGGYKFVDIFKKLKSMPAFAAEHAVIPHIAGLGGVARAVLSNLVHDTLVCIDDFERKGKNVGVNEIMGTIAQLRDARKCKVVLILNENSLDEQEISEFGRYAEKVINTSFQFEPTPAESASIAFPADDPLSQILRESCEGLGITNIRVITKIGSYARALMELLKDVDADVTRGVLRSLIVIVWSMISPDGEGAPDLTYLVEKRQQQYFAEKVQFTEEEDKWGMLLTSYGFSYCDEFDLLLIDDVRNGFFNEDKIKRGILTYLNDAKRARAQAAFEAAWKPFHESFDDNAEEVAKSIFEGCSDNIMYLTPRKLSSAVSVLKVIGRPGRALELLDLYMQARGGENIFDVSEDLFGSDITDPDVVKAFAEKAGQAARTLPTPLEAASRIYKGGWSSKDEQTLVNLSVDDFIALFKATKEPDRSVLIFGCLQFRKTYSPTVQQRGIAEMAEAALIRIGQESPLNAHRLLKFKIAIGSAQGSLDDDGQPHRHA